MDERHGVRSWLIFGTGMLLAGVVFLPLAWAIAGPMGLLSSAVAMAVCTLAGAVAFALVACFRSPGRVVTPVLLGMLPRMGLPLAACLLVYFQFRPLLEAGFVYYILAFYFVMLVVETMLLAGQLSPQTADT